MAGAAAERCTPPASGITSVATDASIRALGHSEQRTSAPGAASPTPEAQPLAQLSRNRPKPPGNIRIEIAPRPARHTRRTPSPPIARFRSGSVCVNDVIKQATNPQLPFRGAGPSGHGRDRGRHGFGTFTFTRPATRRPQRPDPFALAPPCGALLGRLQKLLR